MRAFHLAVLFRRSHCNELMMNPLRSQGLLKGVRLEHMREEDIGKLYTMVGLDLLDGEGEGAKQAVKEKDAGLRGEFRADPDSLEAGAIVYSRVEVLLKRFGTIL
jgi:hypothetical protein